MDQFPAYVNSCNSVLPLGLRFLFIFFMNRFLYKNLRCLIKTSISWDVLKFLTHWNAWGSIEKVYKYSKPKISKFH